MRTLTRFMYFSCLGATLLVGSSIAQSAESQTEMSSPSGPVTSAWDDTEVFDGLHPSVQAKIVELRRKMALRGRRVYLMGGARSGPLVASMHNQALAVDVTIDYMTTLDVAVELRAVGFTCAIPYFNKQYEPCHMAHGDLRGTTLAKGPYVAGGDKAADCPGGAVSRSRTCDNSAKAQWNYLRELPTAARWQQRSPRLHSRR